MTNAQYLQQNQKLLLLMERKYVPGVASAIDGQMQHAAELLPAMGVHALTEYAALLLPKVPLQKVLTQLITEAGLRYAWLTHKDLLINIKKPAAEQKARLWGFSFDEAMAEFIRTYLARSLPGIISSITKTTAKKITDILTNGLNEGWSIDMMTKALQRTGDYSHERAVTIVRTEAVSSQNALAIDNARKQGLKMNKVWLSNKDKLVRVIPKDEADHAHAHGQKVPLDSPFKIETEKQGFVDLDFPGDKRTASIVAWIKCRCTLRFEVVRDQYGIPIRVAENVFRTEQ